ncbi:hypothetical protein C8R46DRAFT_1362386 [Mycena filopes]|nr:hypothetical protein C8R46DRAFT_1362386 [Mycena filopes]
MADTSSADVLASLRLQAVKYVNAAATVILVFDWALTLQLEVSLIWPSKWSAAKILYLSSRYTPFFDVPLELYYLSGRLSFKRCAQVNTAIVCGTIFGLATSEAIFVLRTYALSGRRRKVLIIFGTMYLVSITTVVVVLGIFLRAQEYSAFPLGLPGCNITGGPLILAGLAFILLLLNETVLMSYTIWIGLKLYRRSHSPLVETLYRDGITYFMLIFLSSVANVALLVAAPDELSQLLNTFIRVLHSVLSARVLLHIVGKEKEEKTNTDGLGELIFGLDSP